MNPQHAPETPHAHRIAVIIATKGRRDAIPHVLRLLEAQTRRPDLVVVSASTTDDVDTTLSTTLPTEYLFGPAGLPAQRNRGLERVLPVTDIVVFLDDDFVPAPDWLARCVEGFDARPNAVGVTGAVIHDGASSQSDALDWDQAAALLADDAAHAPAGGLVPVSKLYGCNMAYRCAAIGELRFDERLVLYGWLEDMDFSRAVGHRGQLLAVHAARGVHLGLRSGGRTSGKRLGFSQIVNVWYLHEKGALSAREAFANTLRALLANSGKSFFPEAHIDRRGRLAGNLLGLRELMSGHCRPERSAEL